MAGQQGKQQGRAFSNIYSVTCLILPFPSISWSAWPPWSQPPPSRRPTAAGTSPPAPATSPRPTLWSTTGSPTPRGSARYVSLQSSVVPSGMIQSIPVGPVLSSLVQSRSRFVNFACSAVQCNIIPCRICAGRMRSATGSPITTHNATSYPIVENWPGKSYIRNDRNL